MGVVKTITARTFPKQGKLLDDTVSVCFHYNTEERIQGVCVRDDVEEPGVTIFKLDNGRYVLATECMYQYVPRKHDR